MEWRSEFDALPGVCRCLSRRSAHLITRLPRRDAFMNQRRRPMLRGRSTIVLPLLVVLALPTGTRPPLRRSPMAATQSETGMHTPWPHWGIRQPHRFPAGQPPQLAATHMAMVQIAVYDAVNSITGGFAPQPNCLRHHRRLEERGGGNRGARRARRFGTGSSSAAAAGRDRPAERAVRRPAGEHCRWSRQGGRDRSRAAAAAAILIERDGDGRYVPFSFTQGTDPGVWRPTSGVSDPYAFMANVRPFALNSSSQFRTDGPKRLKSPAYAREYKEVKKVGSATSVRTPEQQALADFYTVSPLELFNRAFRGLTDERGLSLAKEARLFAMLNVAGADALINCWNDKEFFHFWRPITAIQEGNADGNPRTKGDTGWNSYVTTPPYPEHSSGYNCVTAAYMHTARLLREQPDRPQCAKPGDRSDTGVLPLHPGGE